MRVQWKFDKKCTNETVMFPSGTFAFDSVDKHLAVCNRCDQRSLERVEIERRFF